MELFLQILGGICLGFVALLVLLAIVGIVGGSLVRWWLLRTFADLRYVDIPPRLHLVRREEVSWKVAEEVERLTPPLRQLQFQHVGDFITELDYLRLRAFAQPRTGVYAIVFEHDKAGVWLELICETVSGGGMSYSTAREGEAVDPRPGWKKANDPEATPEALYERLLRDRPAEPLRPASIEAFVSDFERNYAASMDWRNSRGGATEEEIRRILSAKGEAFDDAAVAEIRRDNVRRAIEGLKVALLERLEAQTSMNVREWEEKRDRVHFVFDLMTTKMVQQLFVQATDDEAGESGDDDENGPPVRPLPSELAGLSARELFVRLNEQQAPERRHERLGELSEPVAADVYVAPMSEEDFDEA